MNKESIFARGYTFVNNSNVHFSFHLSLRYVSYVIFACYTRKTFPTEITQVGNARIILDGRLRVTSQFRHPTSFLRPRCVRCGLLSIVIVKKEIQERYTCRHRRMLPPRMVKVKPRPSTKTNFRSFYRNVLSMIILFQTRQRTINDMLGTAQK